MNRRSLHPRAYGARSIPCYAPPPPLSHKQLNGLGKSNVISEVGSLCASGSGSSPARPWFTVPTILPRITLRPCHALCERYRQCSSPSPAQSTPRPPGKESLRDLTLRSCCDPTALHPESIRGSCRAPYPALLTELASVFVLRNSAVTGRSQVPRQRPMRNAAMRRVQFVVPCRRQRRPRRHLHRVNACRRLGAGSPRDTP